MNHTKQTEISRKYAALAREIMIDEEERMAKSQSAGWPSPQSVLCFPNESTQKSLASYIEAQDTLPSFQPSLTSSRKKVSFHEWVCVKETISRKEIRKEDKKKYWLSFNDYLDIRVRNRMLIRGSEFYPKGGPVLPSHSELFKNCGDDIEKAEDGDYLFLRGLVCSQSESFERKTLRRNAQQRVFIEQEFQWLEGFLDEEAIAERYLEITSPYCFQAIAKAIQDRKAVLDYLGVEK